MPSTDTTLSPHYLSLPAFTLVSEDGSSAATLTWGQLEARARQFVRLMQYEGIEPGDSIAVILPNQLEFAEVILGSQWAGLRFVALNSHSNVREVLEILHKLRPRVVLVATSFAGISQLSEQLPISVICPFMVGQTPPASSASTDWMPYEDLRDSHDPAHPLPELRTGEQLRLSGGTTGTSKIIVLQPSESGPRWGASAADIVPAGGAMLLPTPLYHSAGMLVLLRALASHAHLVVMERWSKEHNLVYLETLGRYGVTFSFLVPALMQRLLGLGSETLRRYNTTGVRILHTAAPCPTEVKRDFMVFFPETHELYGASEGHGLTYCTPEDARAYPGTVGQPLGCRVIIADLEGNELPDGEEGIIWFAGGGRMRYLGAEEETARSYNRWGHGTTHDVGYLHHGRLFITGRAKDMMIVGGVNVYPGPIEDVLLGHGLVADAVVVSQPHPTLGEVPVAAVQLRDLALASADLAVELALLCRTKLDGHRRPAAVHFVEIPRQPSGKVRRSDVLEYLRAHGLISS